MARPGRRNQHENNDKLITVENDCNEYIIHYPLSVQLLTLTVTTIFQVITSAEEWSSPAETEDVKGNTSIFSLQKLQPVVTFLLSAPSIALQSGVVCYVVSPMCVWGGAAWSVWGSSARVEVEVCGQTAFTPPLTLSCLARLSWVNSDTGPSSSLLSPGFLLNFSKLNSLSGRQEPRWDNCSVISAPHSVPPR